MIREADRKSIETMCLSRWGITAQFNQLAEESAELAVAALHMNRDSRNDTPKKRQECLKNLVEEVAGVLLLIEELTDAMGLNKAVSVEQEAQLHNLKVKLGMA